MRTTARLCLLGLLGLVCLAGPALGLRALGLFPITAHSHNVFFKSLFEQLAARGHEVVMFSPFPQKKPLANYTDVDTSGGEPSGINSFSFDRVSNAQKLIPGQALFESMTRIGGLIGPRTCRKVLSMPEFDKLMKGSFGRFDVVLTEVFGSDCFAAVAHKLKVPLIGMSSSPDVSWMHERLGSPDNPAYLNNFFGGYTGSMNLWQRFVNTVTTLYVNYLHKMIMNDPADAIVREFLGADTPSITELVKNTSLVLLNRYVGVHAARPVTPNVVNVGGLHIKKRDALLSAFSKLPQRVLWKFETPDVKLPANVRIAPWMPQMAILSHPKTMLFMTHAGLMGSMEAIHSAVPMLCIPLFGDQMSNTELYLSLGVAERLDIRTASEDSILSVLKLMTENPKYRRRAREVSALFRDRPRQAADEAVWWVEYVVRHRGAPHLKPIAADLPLYQYLLLDVLALALSGLLVIVLLARAAVLFVFRKIKLSPALKKKKRE